MGPLMRKSFHLSSVPYRPTRMLMPNLDLFEAKRSTMYTGLLFMIKGHLCVNTAVMSAYTVTSLWLHRTSVCRYSILIVYSWFLFVFLTLLTRGLLLNTKRFCYSTQYCCLSTGHFLCLYTTLLFVYAALISVYRALFSLSAQHVSLSAWCRCYMHSFSVCLHNLSVRFA